MGSWIKRNAPVTSDKHTGFLQAQFIVGASSHGPDPLEKPGSRIPEHRSCCAQSNPTLPRPTPCPGHPAMPQVMVKVYGIINQHMAPIFQTPSCGGKV